MKVINDGYEHNGFECGWTREETSPVVEGDIRLIDGYLFRAYSVKKCGWVFKRWEVLWVPMEPKDVKYHPRTFPFRPVQR